MPRVPRAQRALRTPEVQSLWSTLLTPTALWAMGIADAYHEHYRHYQLQRQSKLFNYGRLRLCLALPPKISKFRNKYYKWLSIPFLVTLYQIIGSRIQCSKFQHLAWIYFSPNDYCCIFFLLCSAEPLHVEYLQGASGIDARFVTQI